MGSVPAPAGSSYRIGLDLSTAREKVRVARALETLPLLADALARGELSYAKVRALTRVATPETEARLLGVGRGGTAAHVERIVRGWRYMDRKAEAREAARQHASRALHVHQDEDGTVVLRGRLEPEVGALLMKALAAARERLYQRSRGERVVTRFDDPDAADRPTMAQERADALALLMEAALDHGLDPGAPGERYQVVVHVDAAGAGGPGPARPIRARGRGARSRGNVAAPGVRREPGGDAARRGWPHRGGRSTDPDDSPGAAARASPPRPRLSLPGLQASVRSGSSRSALGAGRPDHALQPRVALPPTSPCGARRGLSGRSTARRRTAIPATRRTAAARGPSPGRGARRSGPGAQGTARRAGPAPPRADGVPVLAGRAPESGLRDRCLASAGQPTSWIVTERGRPAFDGMITAADGWRAAARRGPDQTM